MGKEYNRNCVEKMEEAMTEEGKLREQGSARQCERVTDQWE
jgi:hypothetical protein